MAIKYNAEDIADHHGVAAVVKNDKGEILMQEHVKYGFWTIPVGKVKPGQVVEEGLKQELFEECSITVSEFKELKQIDLTYDRDDHKVLVNNHIFEILNYDGQVINSEPHKHKQQLFMPLEKIMQLPYLSDSTILYLETLGFFRKARID